MQPFSGWLQRLPVMRQQFSDAHAGMHRNARDPVRKPMPDVRAVNLRYKGAMMNDVAKTLATNPKVRERLTERLEKRERTTRVNSYE